MPAVHAASTVASTNYRLEISIPWSAIGLNAAPIGQNLSVDLEILTGGDTQQQVERIPDASPMKPATWMPLKLIEAAPDALPAVQAKPEAPAAYDMLGRRIDDSRLSHGIFIKDGKKITVSR